MGGCWAGGYVYCIGVLYRLLYGCQMVIEWTLNMYCIDSVQVVLGIVKFWIVFWVCPECREFFYVCPIAECSIEPLLIVWLWFNSRGSAVVANVLGIEGN